MPSWVMYVGDILIFAVVFMGWILAMRWRYGKASRGKLVAEFWSETGFRYYRLLNKEPNGIEVKAPTGHQVPRYFFNKDATGTTEYPRDPILGLRFLQVPVPIVSWQENNPEPINPRTKTLYVTATLLASIEKDDFLAFAHAASEEIQKLQLELTKALASRLNKTIIYILLVLIILLVGVGTYLGYMNYNMSQKVWG